MTDYLIYGAVGVVGAALMYVIYRVTYARAYEQGYRHATEDRTEDDLFPDNIKGIGGMCGKCGWEAPQAGTIAEIFQSIVTHECDDEE